MRTLPLVGLLVLLGLSAATPAHAVLGDANGTGVVTVADGVEVLRAASGLTSPCDLEHCDVDESGFLTVSDAVGALRQAIGLPTSPTSFPKGVPPATTQVEVHLSFAADVGLQGFQLEVGYPLTKGSFTGSADGVACTLDGDAGAIFIANDRDDGTLVLIAAKVSNLTFPIEITCQFDQIVGETLTPADLPITVIEVVQDNAAGDPASLLSTVTVESAPTCGSVPIRMTVLAGGVLDLGWTGIGHGSPLSADWSASFPLTCDPGASVCDIDGQTAPDRPAGPPLSLSAGGVSMCVLSSFRDVVTGTYDCEGGCTEANVKLLSRVFLVQDATSPCPVCVGDETPNDAIKGGTCNGGTTPGDPCDVGGTNARFDAASPDGGHTSNDCLPTGSSVGELDLDLNPLTTGTVAVAASVDCLSGVFPPHSCYCPGQVQANPCFSGECPASGFCENGPIDGVCSDQAFRQCRSDTGTADCEDIFPGAGTCIEQPRPCFGNEIVRTGTCGSSLVGIFCLPSTRAAAINVTFGLPGPAALSLPIAIQPAPPQVPTPIGTPSPTETPGACDTTPRRGCYVIAEHHQSTILMNDRQDGRDEFAWRWLGGESTPAEAFGDPTTLTSYAFCAYAPSPAIPALVLEATVRGGEYCNGKPCWHARPGGGFVYRDPSGHADGLTRFDLVPGPTGTARIVVKGHGTNLPLPALPLTSPLNVQLQSETGECWESTYNATDLRRNDLTRYRATSRH